MGNIDGVDVADIVKVAINPEISAIDRAAEEVKGAEKQLLGGSEWDNYFKDVYGDNNVEWTSKTTLSISDRLRIKNWTYSPNDDVYIKYKEIYQNERYFNQADGSIIYPGMKDDININGFVDGYSQPNVLEKGKIYTRFGDNKNAKFFSASDVPLEQRALPPGTENKPLVEITTLKDIPCSSGEIAPWFDQPGGGLQYYSDIKIKALDGSMVEATLENLKKNLYIKVKIIN